MSPCIPKLWKAVQQYNEWFVYDVRIIVAVTIVRRLYPMVVDSVNETVSMNPLRTFVVIFLKFVSLLILLV